MAKSKTASLEARDNRTGIIFLMPALVVLFCIIAFPVLYSLMMSFLRWRPTETARPFVGFGNYIKVFADPRFLVSFRNTFVYAFVGAVGKLTVGFSLALLLNQQFKGRGLVRALLMLPWVVPVTASITTWSWMLDGMYGIVNLTLLRMGAISQAINFLGDKNWALASVLTVGIWMGYPQFMLMILAGLQAIPGELYEAAKVEGANTFQRFFYITVPSLRNILTIAIILSVIWTFNAFNVVWLMTRGGPSSSTHILNTLAYEFAFINMRYDQAAALSVVILGVLAIFLYFFAKLQKES
jgi:multiple sugar transport system permease protein